MDGWMDGWMVGWINGWTDSRTNGQTDGRTNGRTDGRMDGQMDSAHTTAYTRMYTCTHVDRRLREYVSEVVVFVPLDTPCMFQPTLPCPPLLFEVSMEQIEHMFPLEVVERPNELEEQESVDRYHLRPTAIKAHSSYHSRSLGAIRPKSTHGSDGPRPQSGQ